MASAVDVFSVKDMFGLKVVNQAKLAQVAGEVETSIRDFDARFEPLSRRRSDGPWLSSRSRMRDHSLLYAFRP